MKSSLAKVTKAGFGYDNSLQTDDAGYVDAAVLAHVACVVCLQTNDVRRNRKGVKSASNVLSFHSALSTTYFSTTDNFG